MHRYPEIDLLRTLAVALMVVYHAAFDLAVFYGWDLSVYEGPWLLLARGTAILFLLLAGVSAAISFERMKTRPPRERLRRHLLRFLRIGAAAAAVTAATYAANPETYVRFGILHLIAVTGLLLPLAVPLKERAALAGVGFIFAGLILLQLQADTGLLLPLGMRPADFQTVDYFPLLPWAGVILLGYAAGHALYVRFPQWRAQDAWARTPAALAWPGRHALACYLLHQPIILGVLWLLLGRPSF